MSKDVFNTIVVKFEKLDEYLEILKDVQKVNKKSFVNDYHFHGVAERYLQLSIEAILDIGKLIIVEKGLKRPEENEEIFHILGDNKILPKKLVSELDGIARFRNILVHVYENIDRNKIYEKLQNNLDDFLKFKKAVAKYLRKRL